MNLYKGTVCTIILAGTLEEAPIIYKMDNGKQTAEFFLTVYKCDSELNNNCKAEQFFLYRIIVKDAQALKVKHLAQLGVQLFVEGELQGYHIMESNGKNLVIAEVTARKLSFENSSESYQLEKERHHAQPNFFSANIIDISKSQYLH